jgi:hypothetical protein
MATNQLVADAQELSPANPQTMASEATANNKTRKIAIRLRPKA